MAKVRGPLLSMGAAGQIGRSQVYANWKGIKYARVYVIPANPNTTGQQLTRDVFRAADQQWKYLGALAQAPFIAAVKGRPMVPRNMLMKTEIPVIREQPDISNWVFSPGNGGGIAPASVSINVGSGTGEAEVDITAPEAPVDWTLLEIVAAAIPQRAPDDLPDELDVEGSAAAPATSVTLTGLTSSQEYVIGGWLKWQRKDGLVVYGHSQTVTYTVT